MRAAPALWRSSTGRNRRRSSMTQRSSGGVVETIKTVVYALLIAIGIRSFLFEPFHIPSGSMIPTLLVGDYLFVAKYVYGYSRYSFPFSPNLFSGRILGSDPQRGDVVVFRKPTDVSEDYIKRIVGLPGDHLQMKEGILYINNQAVKRERVADYVDEGGHTSPQYIETLPNGVSHPILEGEGDNGPLDNTQEFIVDPGHYFAMGDNRDDSLDSRTPQVGQVPAENLIGRAKIIFFSSNGSAHWWEIWKWPFAIRYGRLFHLVK
jgi:signal peptidase I